MRELKPNPCHKCTDKRFIGCHGKNEDGTWRCKEYGEAYEKADADYRAYQNSADADYRAYQNSAEAIMGRYDRDGREKRKAKAAAKKHVLAPINQRRQG